MKVKTLSDFPALVTTACQISRSYKRVVTHFPSVSHVTHFPAQLHGFAKKKKKSLINGFRFTHRNDQTCWQHIRPIQTPSDTRSCLNSLWRHTFLRSPELSIKRNEPLSKIYKHGTNNKSVIAIRVNLLHP